MTIVVTGGGSGGHITPVLAVASALKQAQPKLRIIYIGQTSDALLDVPAHSPAIDEVVTIRAGKLRRYHGEGAKQLLDIPTQARNVRDVFYTLFGVWQSYRLLRKYKPSVVFTRGGFVSVPVAFAARMRRIPYVTHDSDSTPSLANRLIARGARWHAVALPAELYPYPIAKTKMVGIPVGQEYQPITPTLFAKYRHVLELDHYEHVLLVTGGGNGAAALNRDMVANASYLLKRYPRLGIVHFAGRGLEADTQTAYEQVVQPADVARVRILGFSTDFWQYSAAADVIIARGGATNLAEFALQAKACIIVPPKQLVWAIRNTEVLAERQAIVHLTEAQAEQEQRLGRTVAALLSDDTKRQQLAQSLSEFARPQAADDIARLLLQTAGKT